MTSGSLPTRGGASGGAPAAGTSGGCATALDGVGTRTATELSTARIGLEASSEEAALLRAKVLPGTERALQALHRGYAAGRSTQLELLDAERARLEAREQYLSALVEAHQSAHQIERLTGVHRDTILRAMVRAGDQCQAFMDRTLHNLPLEHVQLDEMWTFVGIKNGRIPVEERRSAFAIGDQYLFWGIDEETKLIPSWLIGKRTADNARRFLIDLAERLPTKYPTVYAIPPPAPACGAPRFYDEGRQSAATRRPAPTAAALVSIGCIIARVYVLCRTIPG